VISYWKEGCKFLLNKDPIFKKYYNSNHSLKLNKNKFDVLFKSICSQQISVSAAMSIYNKSKKVIGPINYLNFKKNISKISKLPLSKNKKKSIKSLIDNYDLVKKIKTSNPVINDIANLTKIFGIGNWTVEMFSIFHLGLSDVMPIGDLGFINAYKKYYKDPDLLKFNKNSKKWSKYSTIVTWYLWSSYDSDPLYL
jgi:DNA-3-methyladenine glycosylase II